MERCPAAQALIECDKRIEAERNALKAALQKIHAQPNCRYEVESQLGEEIWDALHSAYSEPLYDQAALDAAVAAERERLRVMLTAHLDQTVLSHHVTLSECHAARNALQLVLDEWASRLSEAARVGRRPERVRLERGVS